VNVTQRLISVAVCPLLAAGCFSTSTENGGLSASRRSDGCSLQSGEWARHRATEVSIYSLLAVPGQHEGELVYVRGAAETGFQKRFLFDSTESAAANRYMNGIWLDLDEIEPRDVERIPAGLWQRAEIGGIFRESSQAPYGWSTGTITVQFLIFK
jgi:hypothetical protein